MTGQAQDAGKCFAENDDVRAVFVVEDDGRLVGVLTRKTLVREVVAAGRDPREVQLRDPGVIFLAEAFTRRAVMRELAKLGFTQGYTYFTWKNSRHEMVEYFDELAWGEEKEYFRPNFFVNTPDILTEELQHGGRPSITSPAIASCASFSHSARPRTPPNSSRSSQPNARP